MQVNKPIGVFDSGIGGLTVVKELMRLLPYEEIIYFGDTARVPYGGKSREIIIKFANQIVQFLILKGVKLIVAACNTVSSNALDVIKRNYSIPIVGVIEPGAIEAVRLSKKNIGIIGTKATIESHAYKKAIQRLSNGKKIYEKACPLFVPIVEEGYIDKEATELIAKDYLLSLDDNQIDTLILGCTHYPVLRDIISKVLPEVQIVDSAKSTAVKVKEVLKSKGLLRKDNKNLHHHFYLSDIPRDFEKISKRFLGQKIEPIRISLD
ncbi:MAG TPA: glutamate racemase [bacterium (Candidatus Stahlbacteria)]|nr:glutamate racemase [Candidatus Stahlbacteria bacterium]